jgi:tetratricopeptide (TPR) repeat protein
LLAAAPLAALALLACYTTVRTQAASGAITKEQGGPPLVMLLTMLPVFADYLRLIVVPTGLAFFHHVPLRETIASSAVVAGVVLAALAACLVWLLARRARYALFWWGWYLAGLLPVLNIIPLNTLMAERYLYLPMVGVAGCAALLLAKVGEAVRPRPALGYGMAALATAGLVLLAFGTARQTCQWRTDLAVWRNALAHSPERPTAWYNLANAYRDLTLDCEKARPDWAGVLRGRAIRALRVCLARFGPHPLMLGALGGLVWETGDHALGLSYARQAVALDPESALQHANYGKMLLRLGRTAEGSAELERALRLAPTSKDPLGDEARLHLMLANVYEKLGRHAAAIDHARAAAALARDPATQAAAEKLISP